MGESLGKEGPVIVPESHLGQRANDGVRIRGEILTLISKPLLSSAALVSAKHSITFQFPTISSILHEKGKDWMLCSEKVLNNIEMVKLEKSADAEKMGLTCWL